MIKILRNIGLFWYFVKDEFKIYSNVEHTLINSFPVLSKINISIIAISELQDIKALQSQYVWKLIRKMYSQLNYKKWPCSKKSLSCKIYLANVFSLSQHWHFFHIYIIFHSHMLLNVTFIAMAQSNKKRAILSNAQLVVELIRRKISNIFCFSHFFIFKTDIQIKWNDFSVLLLLGINLAFNERYENCLVP